MTADGLSGRMDGATHIYPVRVFFEDTDAGGVVYHASYLRFAERARTEMMRLIGIEHTRLIEREGVVFTVRRVEIDYLRPARLDDLLEVRTRLLEVHGASILAEQTVRRGAEEIARAVLRLALIGRGGRPARIPPVLRQALDVATPTRKANSA
jgi:acyl-CoA thioester hydrolase